MKEIKTSFKPRTGFCDDKVGNLLFNWQTILARWARYFKGGGLNMEEDIMTAERRKK
jgi:hypothetical protein